MSQGNFQGISFYEAGGAERLFVGHTTYINHDNSWRMVQQPGNIFQAKASTTISSVDTMKKGVLELAIGSSTSGTASLWVGSDTITPVNVSVPPMATATGLSLLNVRYVAVAGDANFTLDNLRIGSTPGDVVAVPEPGSIAILVGGALFVGMCRRRGSREFWGENASLGKGVNCRYAGHCKADRGASGQGSREERKFEI